MSLFHVVPLGLFLFAFAFFTYVEAQEPIVGTTIDTQETSLQPQAIDAIRQVSPEERAENREARLDERQASTSERILEKQTLRAERQAALQEVRQKRVLNLGANISNRMEAAIARFYDIVARFEQRITKLKAAGVDTAAAETKIREASQALAEARAILSDIDTLVYDATTSTEPQSNWAVVRITYQEAGQRIRASHQALREAISLLKIAVDRPNTPIAISTSTASTTE